MESLTKYAGWLLAVIMMVVCAVLFVSLQDADPTDVVDTMDAVPMPASGIPGAGDLEEVRAEAADLRQELADLRAQLSEKDEALRAALAKDSADTKPARGEESPDAEGADESKTNDEEPGPSRGERIANAQMAMVADMTYQNLFDQLGIGPEARDGLKGVIGAHMLDMQQFAQGAMQSRDRTAKDVHAEMEAKKATLRAELGKTLTEDGLAAWDAYEPVADQMLYERLVDGQLNMMAPGLSEENRVLTSQVMAEELVREFDVYNQSDQIYSLDNYNDAQARALQVSLDRLSTALDQDQFDRVNGFVTQALAMFDAMSDQQPAP